MTKRKSLIQARNPSDAPRTNAPAKVTGSTTAIKGLDDSVGSSIHKGHQN